MNFPLIVIMLLTGWGAYDWYVTREITHPPGQIASDAPVQRSIQKSTPIVHQGATLTPRATFSVTARVLARERYRIDSSADIIPIDIALGWGAMSDTAFLTKLTLTQRGRFLFWSYGDQAPLPPDVLVRSASNMHIIPADDSTRATLLDVRVGDVLEIDGDLVDVSKPNGWSMKTSLSREDTGDGACEIVYVRSVKKRLAQ